MPTINFIRGFFDAEGCTYIEGKSMVIEMNQYDKDLIMNLAMTLKRNNIYPYIRYQEYLDKRRSKIYSRYVLRIKRKSSVYKFLTKIGLHHPKHIKKISCLRPLQAPKGGGGRSGMLT